MPKLWSSILSSRQLFKATQREKIAHTNNAITVLFLMTLVLASANQSANADLLGLGDNGTGNTAYLNAGAISGDGSTVVGDYLYYPEGSGTSIREAYIWTETGGFTNLGTLPGSYAPFSGASDVSFDGSVVVGSSRPTTGETGGEAFRWTASAGMHGLGDLPGGFYISSARSVSADGNIVVGSGTTDTGAEPFRWVSDGSASGGVMSGLGDLAGGSFASRAYATSVDGTTIVGQGTTDIGIEPFRWTDGTMTGLGILSGFSGGYAVDVSGDGSVVVGTLTGENPSGFRWTDSNGMQTIADWLTAAGETHSWTQYLSANGVSDDGNVVVGKGRNPSGYVELYLARVAGATSSGAIWMTDFTNSLGDVNKGLALGHKINTLMGSVVSNFASSGPMMMSDHLHGKTILSPVAMYADGSEIMAAGIAGEHVLDAFAIKAAIMGVDAEDDGRYNGDVELSGYSLSLALNMYPGKMIDNSVISPLNITIGYGRGFYDGDFDRTYLNGATPETSNGDPDVDTMSAFIEAGWFFALSEKASLRPYVELFYQETEMDSYTESGGSFPGRVSAQDEDNTKYSLGLEGTLQVNDRFKIGADLVGVKLSDDQGPDLVVNVPGIGSFVYSGVEYDDTWAELALNAQWGFTSDLWLSGEVRGTTGSDYPEDWSASVELSYAF